jgi:hypothetical protein
MFDSFPYLWSRVGNGLYHILLMPELESLAYLQTLAMVQAHLNALPTCLVTGYNSCYYYGENGRATFSEQPPWGGIIAFGKLKPFRQFSIPAEREENLKRFAAGIRGYAMGDLRKGGRPATPEELEKLAGQVNGIPTGLTKCPMCGEWRGSCLDPNKVFAGFLMQVDCKCNPNRCSKCGGNLNPYGWPLGKNSFENGQVWHHPTFACFGHTCPPNAVELSLRTVLEEISRMRGQL